MIFALFKFVLYILLIFATLYNVMMISKINDEMIQFKKMLKNIISIMKKNPITKK
jgi:hypothetical protein